MAALTAALIGLTVLKAGAEIAGQQKAAKAVKRQGAAEASLLEQNAALAEAQGKDAIARGQEASSRHLQNVEGLVGEQRVALAAQGVTLGSGSAHDAQESAFALGEFDALTIRNNAAREAYGFQVQAEGYRMQAGYTRTAARNTARNIRSQAWGTLLNAGVQAATLGADWLGSRGAKVPKVPKVPKPIGTSYGGGTFG